MCLPPTPSFVQPSPSSRGGPVASLFRLPCGAEWLRDADGRPRGIVQACAPCIIRSIQRSASPIQPYPAPLDLIPTRNFVTLRCSQESRSLHDLPSTTVLRSISQKSQARRMHVMMCVSACGKHRESRGRHPESSTRLRRFRHGSHYMGAVHGTGHAVTVFSTDHGCTAPPLTGPWTVPTRVSPPSAAPPTNRNRDANRPHRNHPTGSAPTLQALASESHTEIFSSIFSTFLLFSLSLSLSL
jgi:hypothetical protein